jgi:hypothetical protein
MSHGKQLLLLGYGYTLHSIEHGHGRTENVAVCFRNMRTSNSQCLLFYLGLSTKGIAHFALSYVENTLLTCHFPFPSELHPLSL